MSKLKYILIFLFISTPQLQSWHCDPIGIEDLIQHNSQIQYLQCNDPIPFRYQPLPNIDNHWLHPYEGIFHKTFIATIPNGQVYGKNGWVLIQDQIIANLIWRCVMLSKDELADARQTKPVVRVHGRVAVIAQAGYTYYYHWLVEVLGRLALLEMHGVEYDFLYVPTDAPFMKEILQLWGIEQTKIIDASDDAIIQADQLIVPSLVAGIDIDGNPRLAHYIPEYIVTYIRTKLLQSYALQNIDFQPSKKIFISRKDALARKMINEDEVFSLFEAQGFQRYILSDLTITQQIRLFQNAEIIIGTLGSGFANVIFCNPDTRIINLFQARRDGTICYLCQNVGLQYQYVKTMEFIDENDGQYDTTVPLEIIKDLIQSLT